MRTGGNIYTDWKEGNRGKVRKYGLIMKEIENNYGWIGRHMDGRTRINKEGKKLLNGE
jgi:hypothetical protein